jgi:hypothetical protein
MTNVTEKAEHVPRRPDWGCRVCGRAWPCPNARRKLLEEFREFPTVLGLYLAGQMNDALYDLSVNELPLPTDLHDRFIDWSRPASPAPDVPQPQHHKAAA